MSLTIFDLKNYVCICITLHFVERQFPIILDLCISMKQHYSNSGNVIFILEHILMYLRNKGG